MVVEPEEEKSKGVCIIDLQSSYFYLWLFLVLKKKCGTICFFQVGLVEEEVKEVAREVDGEEEGLEGEKTREDIFMEGVTIGEHNTTAKILCYQCTGWY